MSGSSDEAIRLWDAATGDGIGKPLEGHSSSVKSVSFSPDGSRIVSHLTTPFVSGTQRCLTLSPHWVPELILNFYHLVGWLI